MDVPLVEIAVYYMGKPCRPCVLDDPLGQFRRLADRPAAIGVEEMVESRTLDDHGIEFGVVIEDPVPASHPFGLATCHVRPCSWSEALIGPASDIQSCPPRRPEVRPESS